jgi:SMC interacting uncharacterized protein involved in chromosome segregation
MVMVLELENIGGFIGKHRFELSEGLNEAIAPNAMGKTSLIKALLAMYVPGTASPEELLNYDADEGYIRVEVNGKVFVRRFKRKEGRVVEVESKPVTVDDRIKYVVLDLQLGEVSKTLVLEAKPDITDYLVRIFKLDNYKSKIEGLKSQIESLEREAEYLEREVAELTKMSEERKKLESERTELERELERVKWVSTQKTRAIQDRIADLRRRLGEIEGRIKDIEERLIPMITEKINELQPEIERLEKEIAEFYGYYKEPDKYVESIKEHIKQIDDFINNLKKELSELISGQDARIPVIRMAMITRTTTCPICGRPVEKSPEEFWGSRLGEVEEEVRKVREAIVKDYEERISRVQEERLNRWKELEEFTKKYNEIREIETVKLPKYRTQLENLFRDLKSYKNEQARLKNEKDSIIVQLENLEKELPEEERKASEKRAEIERRLGEIEQKIKDLEEVIAKKSDAGLRLTEINRKIEELREEQKRTEGELYSIMTKMKDEFARISSEVIRELDFTWFKSIRIVEREMRDKVTGEVKKTFEIKVTRILPSGREVEQSLSTMSTSERSAISLVTILTGYKLKVFEEYKGLVPVLADEALLAFDPLRFEKVVEELKKYAKYVVITKLAEPEKVPKLTIIHKH